LLRDDDLDGGAAADSTLPGVAILRVVEEDVDPGLGEQAAVVAVVDALGGVAEYPEPGPQLEVEAAGRRALVNLPAVVHLVAEALYLAVVERDIGVVDVSEGLHRQRLVHRCCGRLRSRGGRPYERGLSLTLSSRR